MIGVRTDSDVKVQVQVAMVFTQQGGGFKPHACLVREVDWMCALTRDCHFVAIPQYGTNDEIFVLEDTRPTAGQSLVVGFVVKEAGRMCRRHELAREGNIPMEAVLTAIKQQYPECADEFEMMEFVMRGANITQVKMS